MSNDHKGKLHDWVRPEASDVVVFYSGHGVPGLGDRRGYLLPSDGDANRAEITGYPLDLLYANLKKLPAKSVTVFLDACFSGKTPEGMVIKSHSAIIPEARPGVREGLTVLTAAKGNQVASWDEDAKHGLFTHHLLLALRGKADGGDWGNGDGRVTLGEARAYLGDEMTYQARRRFGREQVPDVAGDETRVLALLPKGQPVPPFEPAPPTLELQPVEAVYVTVRTANVRAAATIESSKVATLPTGTEVYVPGRTVDGEWLKVERDGTSLGFIYAPSLSTPPGRAALSGAR